MFDKESLKNRDKTVKPVVSSRDLSLASLTLHELIAKRAEIDTFLPSLTIMEMDLEQELLMSYHQTKALIADVIKDDETPANQKAQLVNTCNSILTQITKSQTDLYNSERLKIMEQCLSNALKNAPDNVSEKFFMDYERELLTLAKA